MLTRRVIPQKGLKRFLPILRLGGPKSEGGNLKVEVRGLEAPELVRAKSRAQSELVEEAPLGGSGHQRQHGEKDRRDPPQGFFFAGTGSQSEFLITDGLAFVGIGTPAANMTR